MRWSRPTDRGSDRRPHIGQDGSVRVNKSLRLFTPVTRGIPGFDENWKPFPGALSQRSICG